MKRSDSDSPERPGSEKADGKCLYVYSLAAQACLYVYVFVTEI